MLQTFDPRVFPIPFHLVILVLSFFLYTDCFDLAGRSRDSVGRILVERSNFSGFGQRGKEGDGQKG